MWNFSYFDKVGGNGTVRSVWNRLKSMRVVRGRKRSYSSDNIECDERKKLKLSLNLSDTCELINNIELQGEEDMSRVVTDSDRSRDEGDYQDVFEQGEWEVAPHSDESFESVLLLSDNDSMPLLAVRESSSSEYSQDLIGGESDSDSGLTDDCVGGVTNLCRDRRECNVRSGVITETGPFIPVSLGFSLVETDDSDWEEVLDSDGRPTGVEKRSFRLNVRDGRTESIDDDWNTVRLLNGIPDETTSRRRVVDLSREGWERYLDDEVELLCEGEGESVNVLDYGRVDLRSVSESEIEWSEPPRATLTEVSADEMSSNRWAEPTRATLMDVLEVGESGTEWSEPPRTTLMDSLAEDGSNNRWTELTRATLRYLREGGESNNEWSEPQRATLMDSSADGRINNWMTEPTRATLMYSDRAGVDASEWADMPHVTLMDHRVGNGSGMVEMWELWMRLVSVHSLYTMMMMLTLTGFWDVWGAALGGGTWAARTAGYTDGRSTTDGYIDEDLSREMVERDDEENVNGRMDEIHGNKDSEKQN